MSDFRHGYDSPNNNNYLDEYDPYLDSGRGGSGSLAAFLMVHDVKYYWIAFFTLWVYWGLLWFLRHVFGDGHMNSDYAAAPQDREAEAVAATETAREGEEEQGERSSPSPGILARMRGWHRKPHVARTHSRLSRASDVLRDLVLLLLSVLVLNTLGRGGTRSVMILAWVFFAFAVVWSILEASHESHIARFLFGVVFYGIALAIGALAFSEGFHEFRR